MDDTVGGYDDDTFVLEERDTVASTETATQEFAPGHNNNATVLTTAETVYDTPAHPESLTELPRLRESGRLGNGLVSPPLATLRRFGCPAGIITGEHVMEQTDYHLSAPLPLTWTRTYRSSQNSDIGLGFGWSAPYFARLFVRDRIVLYACGDGRQIPFPVPAEGQVCRNTVEQLTLCHDANHRYRVLDEHGTTFMFKGTGKTKRLVSMSNAAGHKIVLRYGESGRPIQIIAGSGQQLKLEYNITNRLHALILLDEAGIAYGKPLAQYRYNNQGDLVSVVDAAGHTQHFQYRNHILIRHSNRDGYSSHFQWDRHNARGQCIRRFGDGNSYDHRFEYHSAEKVSQHTDSLGNITRYHYNSLGLVTRLVDPQGGVTDFQYNNDGRLLLERDPLGNTSQYSYDSDGRLIRFVNPCGHTTRFTYDETGRLNSRIDALGMRWRRIYDARGRLNSRIDPQGRSIQYRYDDHGFPTQITDAMKRNRRLEWNRKGELLCQIDSVGNRREYGYDFLGRITEIRDSGQITRYHYDPMGRITEALYPNGASVQLQYTPEGRLSRFVDALGRSTQYRYDGLGQPTERINPHGQSFKYQYDEESNLIALINENGERYELQYDHNQRLIRELGFDGRVQHYGYDAAGRLVSHTVGNSRITQFKRDAMGKLLKKWSSDEDICRYEYDPLGRLARAVNNHCELEFKYSDSGQLIEERQNGVRLRHEFDLNNQRSATRFNNECIEYEYNSQGIFKRIAYNGNTLASVTRNAQGAEIARTCGAVSSFFEYDPMGWLLRQRALAGEIAIVDKQYHFDKNGNLREIDDFNTGRTLFKYDALDRLQALEGPTPERFSFDPAGNLLDARQAFAGAHVKGNRLTIFQDMRFEYDDAGNLIHETKGRKHTRYYYNTQNQLVAVEKDGRHTTYAYDPLGRRVSKQNAGGTTVYLWDGNLLLGEQHLNINDQPTGKWIYIHEPGSFKPLCLIIDGSIYYYHNDHQGKPLCLTDPTGKRVWEADYKAYGQLLRQTGKIIDNPLRFQGQYHDAETGLHYERNRYYHPAIGRFIHQDPLGLLGGYHPYEYVRNPLGWLDPLELNSLKTVAFIKSAQISYNSFPVVPEYSVPKAKNFRHSILFQEVRRQIIDPNLEHLQSQRLIGNTGDLSDTIQSLSKSRIPLPRGA